MRPLDLYVINDGCIFKSSDHSALPYVGSLNPSAFLPKSESSVTKVLVGPASLQPAVLKICLREIFPIVTQLINYSLVECSFSTKWRDVAITPIPKPVHGSSGPVKYRPIANSSVWLKGIGVHSKMTRSREYFLTSVQLSTLFHVLYLAMSSTDFPNRHFAAVSC